MTHHDPPRCGNNAQMGGKERDIFGIGLGGHGTFFDGASTAR